MRSPISEGIDGHLGLMMVSVGFVVVIVGATLDVISCGRLEFICSNEDVFPPLRTVSLVIAGIGAMSMVIGIIIQKVQNKRSGSANQD